MTTKITTVRNGRSLGTTLMTASAKDMHRICADKGITLAEAENAVKVRQWLPYVDDAKEPVIDAEVLWRRIGKPHKRFRDWADHYIKPMIECQRQAAEISATYEAVRGGTKKGYLLSRDVAAKLAMMANTDEGNAVREYFLLMERIAASMAVFAFARADKMIQCDNNLTHILHKAAPKELDKFDRKWWVSDKEQLFKSKLAEVLSGARAGKWREALGSSNGIRDVLTVKDLGVYTDAYFAGVTLMGAFAGNIRKVMELLEGQYGNKVNASAYLMAMDAEAA
ncbi:hypothetical protein EHS17_03860 [Rhodobacteraceae bacterium CH30]|nr:hypothetical protein EHS17_03860 [Rhodobacteraceae bacterium CH30]